MTCLTLYKTNKILALTKLKALEDNKFTVAKMMISVSDWVKKKTLWVVKSRDCVVKG